MVEQSDVFVVGVGRSGTTMMYSLLQTIFAKTYGGGFRSSYEPFIWNRKLFDMPYEQCLTLFGRTTSLSVEGLYQHWRTPLFVDAAERADYEREDFFANFRENAKPHLAKLIRGNGRLAILRALNPRAKIVLLVRNPVDVVNSVKEKFSFFGDDFYPSDYPRFCAELRSRGQLGIDEGAASWAQRQAEYVYRMALAGVSFAEHDPGSIVFEYDQFVQGGGRSVETLCHFLGVSHEDEFAARLDAPVGPITKSVALSTSEFADVIEYDRHHDEMCARLGLTRGKSSVQVRARYDGNTSSDAHDERLDTLTTLALRKIIRAHASQIEGLKSRVTELRTHLEAAQGNTLPRRIRMHSTRLFPKSQGADAYRLNGVAGRCDWVLSTDAVTKTAKLYGNLAVQPGTVFVSMRSRFDAISHFMEDVLPRITRPFVLVTGSEDFTLPNQVDRRWERLNEEQIGQLRGLAADPRVIHWFAENRDEVWPKMSTMPVGYVFEGAQCPVELPPATSALSERPHRVLCAHRVREGEQWSVRRDITRLCQERLSHFTNVVTKELPSEEFTSLVRSHAFVICAPGGGIDPSPKAWSAIANGSIPIIQSSALDDAYSLLPVAFVDDWTEESLNEDKLASWLSELGPEYDEPQRRRKVLFRLSEDFWWNRVLQYKDRARNDR